MFKQKFLTLFLVVVFVVVSLLFSLAYAQETLNILCFQGYTEDVWVKEFERLTGVKVNATYSGMVEEMFTKAAAGGGQYDLVTIDCGSVQRYYENNLLQPIDLSKISNWEKVSQKFKDIDFTVFDAVSYTHLLPSNTVKSISLNFWLTFSQLEILLKSIGWRRLFS